MKIITATKLFIFALLTTLPLHICGQADFVKTQYDSGKVLINTHIPNATSVEIAGMGGSWGLNNLDKSFIDTGEYHWQVKLDTSEISYLTPGFHYYNFLVNGVYTSNPDEQVYFGAGYWSSGIDIPVYDPDSNFYGIRDVPHGTIRIQYYNSTLTGQIRRCFIYLPPGYDTRSDSTYPVLYLQHGSNESEYSWHMQGKVNFILDNLIAEGKAMPMIVVMDNGMTATYPDLVLKDLIPLMNINYHVKTDRENRAVAGLSLGGIQATNLGLMHINTFAYIGAFSGGTSVNLPTCRKRANDSIVVLFNGYGTNDELNIGQNLEAQLNYARLNHVNFQYPGGHEWQVWRNCLFRFAQLLFKPYTYKNPFSDIKENTSDQLIVYPNPFQGTIHFKLPNAYGFYNATYELRDTVGRTLLSYEGDTASAEKEIGRRLETSPDGIYIISVTTRIHVYQVKIMK